jgi:fructose-1,6-bisphosphatase/inositol monophosphatase family enzyme
MDLTHLERLRRLICRLHLHASDTLIAAHRRPAHDFGKVAAVTAADTIYQVDRLSEAAILDWFDQNWPRGQPVQLVMEGIDDRECVTFPQGTPVQKTIWKCILDPIDGTRGLMHDKRAAWILTGLAPQRGPRTSLRDITVAVMTELPTTKQWRADQFSTVRGQGVVARSRDVRTGTCAPLRVRPSQAKDFKHGFASFARFFRAGRSLTAQIEEALWTALHGPEPERSPLVFDDQYISTGGQLAELIAGHDRMIGDLRPLVFAKLGLSTPLVCHPYDICTELILREAGGIVETPLGKPLAAPLDTTTAVAWIGFANAKLARLVRPILRQVLRQFV